MCRVYKTKRGWYIRLCRNLSTSGKHVPVPDGFKLEGKHYPGREEMKGGSTRVHQTRS